MKVKMGNLYMCNCGGIWEVAEEFDQRDYNDTSARCRLVGKYRDRVLLEGPFGDINLETHYPNLGFTSEGLCTSSGRVRFIKEISP